MKNGGPYTKKQREERRNKVFKLHIEQGKSAVAISKILDVSRNTINEDIRFWNDQLDENYLEYDYTSWIAKQFQRLESQRGRLFDHLNEDAKNNLAVEDRIYRLDVKILEFIEKILKGKTKVNTTIKDIDEGLVKRVIRSILLENSSAGSAISEEEIKKEAIALLRCNSEKSAMILFKMHKLGLNLFKTKRQLGELYASGEYNLWEFAMIKGYVTAMEFEKCTNYT